MANEVKIVVTGTNKFGATQAAVSKEITKLRGEVGGAADALSVYETRLDAISAKAKTQVDGIAGLTQEYRGLGSAAAATGKQLDKLGDDAEKVGRKAGDGIRDGIKGGTEKATEAAAAAASGLWSAGMNAARSLVGGISEGVSKAGPYVQGALIAAGVTAAVAAGPLIGGVLAGGVVTAFGAGITGVGIVAAAQSTRVQAVYSNLWDKITSGAREAARPLEQVLVDWAGRAQTILGRSFAPAVRGAIAETVPELDRFGDSLLKAVAKFEPAIAPLTRAFGRVLDDLGPTVERVFAGIADALGDLANSVEENPEALGDFVELMGDVVEMGLDVAGALNTAWEAHKRLFDIVTTPLEWVGLKEGEEQAPETAAALTEVAEVAWQARTPAEQLEAAWSALAEAGDDLAQRGNAVSEMLDVISGRMPTHEEAIQSLNDTIRGLFEQFSDPDNHIDGFGRSLLNADYTVNTATANGSALYDTIQDLQDGFANAAVSVRELEQAGWSHDAAIQKVNEDMMAQYNRLLDNAWQMGLTREQMQRLLDTYGLNPKTLDTLARLDDKDVRSKIADITRTRTVIFQGVLNMSQIPNGRSPDARAHGGVSGGGWTTVGELGPERVKLPPGAQVQPYTASRRELDKTGAATESAGGAAVVSFDFSGAGQSTGLERVFFDWLRKAVRVRGGDPAVFGGGR